MAFPATPLDVTVELAIGADIHADPATWSWTDVTTSIREKQKIGINRGRRNRIGNFPPTRVSATADNTNGDLCRHNPLGQYFGLLKKNTPMRTSVDNGSGPVVRGAVYVPGFPPSWDPSEQDQVVTLQGVGITDRLGRSKPLRSAVFRSMSGIAAGDYVPYVYCSLEDAAGATQFASGLVNGAPAVLSGPASLATGSTPAGSDPLPEFDLNTRVVMPIPAYTNTGQWVMQWVCNIPASPAADPQQLAEWRTPGGTVTRWVMTLEDESPSPDAIYVRGYNAAGTELVSAATAIEHGDLGDETDFYGHTFMFTVATFQNGANINVWFEGIREDGLNMEAALGLVAGTHGGLSGNVTLTSPIDGTILGHPAVFIDPNFNATFGASDADENAAALDGFVGELAHVRAERLCREERVPFTTAATTSQAMGAQGVGRLLDLLRECANADQALLFEDMNFGLTFVSSSERYNLSPAIALAYDNSEILPPWDPDDDDQDYYNEVTAARPGGSSYRAADEDEVDDVGQFADQVNPNVATYEQVRDVAGWRLNLGLNDELTWPAVRPNLTGGGTLLDDWLATDLGQHVHVTGHPSPLAPDTIRQVIEGYSETLGAYQYSVSANLSPASPWDVAELDDDDLGKLDTAGCVMQAAATDVATSFTVATTELPRWTTDAGEMPIPILVSGQVNSVTAIANVSPSFVAAGTVAHASNASVTPSMPAGVQAGDLLLVLAAIRNSGTGTVNTPSGYTVLLTSGNLSLLGKVHTGTESAPTITFAGGVANADTSAQMCAFRGVGITVHASTAQLNGSAQDIAYPALDISRANCAVLYVGWKADDWTSVASPGTEIGEPDTTTGDDQGIVWAYVLQTTAAAVASGSFTVTGGASAISRGAVIALATDVQTMTVTRGTNGVSKAIPIGSQVNVYRPFRLAL